MASKFEMSIDCNQPPSDRQTDKSIDSFEGGLGDATETDIVAAGTASVITFG